MHKFFVCASKSPDFAQSLKIFARSHNRETVTFRNSGISDEAVYRTAPATPGLLKISQAES